MSHFQTIARRYFCASVIAVATFFAPQVNSQDPAVPAIGLSASNTKDSSDDTVTFVRMDSETARTQVLSWLASTGRNAESLKPVLEPWADVQQLALLSGEELLDLCVGSFAAADSATQRFLEASYGAGPIDPLVFDGIRADPFFETQVRQLYGRWLVQHRFYDDAIIQLQSLSPDSAVDPAGLLFYTAVSQAELLRRKDALETLSLLLNNTQDVPHRFLVVAKMMMQNLATQKDDGMPLVERLMKDVERRLELGNSGKDTQQQGDAIVSALDKILKEMEDQKKKQQDGGGGQGDNPQDNQGQQGASESQIRNSSANGEADRKQLKEEGAWGMLDKKAEAKARELIRGKLPANFLDQIGRFSKKLAEQK